MSVPMKGESDKRRGRRQAAAQVVRFLLSGGSAAAVQLLLFYLLTDILGIWYLISTTVAFVLGFFVGFVLQKYWTFGNRHTPLVGRELALYGATGTVNLTLNAAAMYLLVDLLHLWHLASQLLVSGGLAAVSFLLYRLYIFVPRPGLPTKERTP